MKTRNQRLIPAAFVAMAAAGCGTTITNDTTLQDLLTASGLGSVTVGDVVSAIEQFTGASSLLPFGGALTADQQSQLDALSARLSAGEITQQAFHQQAESILGVQGLAGPGRGGFGPGGGDRRGPNGPHGVRGPGLADELNLSADQVSQAEQIFDAMRQDVVALQQDAKTQIDAVLTDDQRQTLDAFKNRHIAGFRVFAHGLDAGVLDQLVDLTDDQKAQIQTILDTVRAGAEARRQQARDDFRAILTADQQATFDALVAKHAPAASATSTDPMSN